MRTHHRLTGLLAAGALVVTTAAVAPAAGAAARHASNHRTPPAGPTLSVTATTLPAATVGTPYTTTLSVTGATGNVTWSPAARTDLPRGLQLVPATGVLSGLPRQAGTVTFAVSVHQNGTSSTATATLSLTVNPAPQVSVTSATLPPATVGTPYATALQITGGTPPYRFAVISGQMPPGLHLDDTGAIAGTPRVAGTYNFQVGLGDRWQSAGVATFSIVVVGGNAPAITRNVLVSGTVGVAYTATLSAAGGTAPYTWAVTRGTLPAGLTLDASTGILSGTPTTRGHYHLLVTVTDATSATARVAVSLTITDQRTPVIATQSLPAGTVGVAYATTLAAGGLAPGVHGDAVWAITAGALPAGLALNPRTGTISGTPTAAVVTSFTVTLLVEHTQVSQTLSLTVLSAA